ncbi:hypothetical protein [Nocardioides marinquilinus]
MVDLSAALLRSLARRQVVTTGTVLVGGTAVTVTAGGPEVLQQLLRAAGARPRTVVERVRRQEDLLAVNLVLRDLDVVTVGGRRYLRPSSGAGTGYLALVLPGQVIGEQVLAKAPGGATGAAPAAGAQLAPPTVLAFTVPSGTKLAYDLNGLLDLEQLDPLWSSSNPERPASLLEAPFRLRMKPSPASHAWSRPGAPVRLTRGQSTTTEVWHLRGRGRGRSTGVDDRLTSVASFTRAGQSTLGALDDADRMSIAAQSGAFQLVDGEVARAPVTVEHLSLTPLGATLDLTASWPAAPSLVAWDHRATIGRDQYVKTVTRGWLAPWGHDAVVVEETWRRLVTTASGRPFAYLRTTSTLLVSPDVDTDVGFARTDHDLGAPVPFKRVRCTTLRTPPITNQGIKPTGGVPLVGAEPVRFSFVGTDWTGREVPFTQVACFVPTSKDGDAARMLYEGVPGSRRVADIGGRPVAVATPDAARPHGTTLPLTALSTVVEPISSTVLAGRRRAPFRPVVEWLDTEVPQVSALAGPGVVRHVYHPTFRASPGNVGGVVLARQTGSEPPPAVGGERTGGLVQVPTYQGLSRTAGAVMAATPAALDQATSGPPSPAAVFEGITLLGGISLADIVDAVDVAGAAGAAGAAVAKPSRAARAAGPAGLAPTIDSVTVDGRTTVTMSITPPLQDADSGSLPVRFRASDEQAAGSLTITTTAATGGTAPAETSLDARLQHVSIELAGLVVLPVRELRVVARTGAPLDVDFVAGDVRYLKALAFLQVLSDVMAVLGAAAGAVGDGTARGTGRGTSLASGPGIAPPSVDVDGTGLRLRQDVAVPDLPLGAFTLSGLSFGFGLTLPYSGALVLDASFAGKQSPFQVTYLGFGGGGYAAIQLTGGTVSLVEVSLHVAGELGMNLGVASGSLSVAVGATMAITPDGLRLTAFFRACGRLSVLQLVSISATFELTLDFHEPETGPTLLVGKATLELRVEVLFVSKTVSTSVTRSIEGGRREAGVPPAGKATGTAGRRALGRSPSTGITGIEPPDEATQPTFSTAYPLATDWSDLCAAYAPVSAGSAGSLS